MAKLQRQINRKVGDKEYSKYVLVIPESNIKEAGFEEGDILSIFSEKGKVTIKRAEPPEDIINTLGKMFEDGK